MSTLNVRVPGSKSLTHRAYVLAAQSATACTVVHPLIAADTAATLGALTALGADVRELQPHTRFQPAALHPPSKALDLRNAGTGLRLLTATAARLPAPSVLDGDASLRSRTSAPLLAALSRLGARITSQDGRPPITVQGPIQAGTVELPASSSSQYASALLLSLPMLNGDSQLRMEPPVASRPYIDLTLDVARHFGLTISSEGDTFHIAGGQQPDATSYEVEGDWSTAAFPLTAAAITGTTVTVDGLNLHSRQGDKAILEHLDAFGCKVHGTTLTGGPLEAPGTIDVAATPDAFPALSIVAAFAKGTTTFTGGGQLRHKECDRIRAMAQGLAGLGVQVEERPEGMIVHGGRPHGGKVHAYHDHRIHMAFAVAGLAADGQVDVDGGDSVNVSYPNFHQDLARIREAT